MSSSSVWRSRTRWRQTSMASPSTPGAASHGRIQATRAAISLRRSTSSSSNGTQGRGGKGAFGALWGMGPRGPLGLYRSHSEWNPVSTGRYLRREGHSFRKKAVRMERPFRMDGSSEWKAVPCVHTAAKTPNRMSADLVGF